MTVTLRPTDWRDLRVIHKNRSKGLYLDTARVLTRGSSFASGVVRSIFLSATGAFTWVCTDECEQPVLGQFAHIPKEPFARLVLLAPDDALESEITVDLLEGLARQAGEHGAFHLLAEIPEDSSAFESLRKAGFVVYARQRIWKLQENGEGYKVAIPWVTAAKDKINAAQSLYHNLVPGLVQQIEPLPSRNVGGLVCHDDGELLGYVDLQSGPRGIWAQPFIHPDTIEVDRRLRDMFDCIPNRRSRSVYLCVRSYQSWLESALNKMEARPGPQQAVMVKHLAAKHTVLRPFTLPQLDGQPEISTPVAQSHQNS
ncbi:MAG: hypothetical protein AB8I58_21555 [Anaerolineales bacterium]